MKNPYRVLVYVSMTGSLARRRQTDHDSQPFLARRFERDVPGGRRDIGAVDAESSELYVAPKVSMKRPTEPLTEHTVQDGPNRLPGSPRNSWEERDRTCDRTSVGPSSEPGRLMEIRVPVGGKSHSASQFQIFRRVTRNVHEKKPPEIASSSAGGRNRRRSSFSNPMNCRLRTCPAYRGRDAGGIVRYAARVVDND